MPSVRLSRMMLLLSTIVGDNLLFYLLRYMSVGGCRTNHFILETGQLIHSLADVELFCFVNFRLKKIFVLSVF